MLEPEAHASTRTVESLGDLIYETRPNVSNLVAGVIISVLLIAGGVALSGYTIRQMFFSAGNGPRTALHWYCAVLVAIIGLTIAYGGLRLLVWVKSLFGFRVYLCSEGFYVTRDGTESVFAWDEIVQVHESIHYEKLPLIKGPARHLMPTIKSRSYTVVRCDGQKLYFNRNIIPRTSLLAGPLSSAARTREIAWRTTEETT